MSQYGDIGGMTPHHLPPPTVAPTYLMRVPDIRLCYQSTLINFALKSRYGISDYFVLII